MNRARDGQLLDFSDSFVISCGTVTFDLSRRLVLLIHNKANGAVLLPKGRKDVNESLEEAAVRETREESGYEVQLISHATKTRATGTKTGSHHEPIAVQQRILHGIRKLVFWYLASADSTRQRILNERETWEEEYETIWRPVEDAPALMTFKEDCQIVERAFFAIVELPKLDGHLPSTSLSNIESMNTSPSTQKDLIRQKVYPELIKVAIPDTRFHLDFSSYITDFQDSDNAIKRLLAHPNWQASKTVFITPDNCLRKLRLAALLADKTVLTTTYGIRRGFYLLSPERISSPNQAILASYLDSMEEPSSNARPVPITSLPPIDLLVTGTGAINHAGIRFGKGHGYFDLEWGILYTLSLVHPTTPCIALVHDCQIVDEELVPEEWDTVCDLVVTPGRTLEVPLTKVKKPTCGILWQRLQPGMLDEIPPLRELRDLDLQRRDV